MIRLVLIILAASVAVFVAVTVYQNRTLVTVVGETRTEQQQAISQSSKATMDQVLQGTMVSATELRAQIADNDFSEILYSVSMLQTMTRGIFENRNSLAPVSVSLPDPALDGTVSAMVLCEEGVDYTKSPYVGLAAHLTVPMIAMVENSEKIDSCYIGFEDGTDLCVDDKAGNKFDENGELISFPVRERPWYQGAVETGGMDFTGIIRDAFSGKLMVTCSAPVVADGELIGVVGVDIILESMDDFVHSAAGEGSGVYVINDNGQVVLASVQDGILGAELSEDAADLRDDTNEALARVVSDSFEQTTPLTEVTVDGRDYYITGSPMPTIGWALLSVVEKEVTEQPEQLLLAEYDGINEAASDRFARETSRTNRAGVFMIVGLLALGVWAALAAAKRIVKPIEDMTRNITRSGRTGEPFEMADSYRTDDEIEVLAEAFDDLSKKTKRYIEDITEITREKERVSTELQMANQIQEGMLPNIYPAFPDRPEFDIYATMDPAREVGGDFFDFFLVDDDHLCMVMADVSGKGVPAALFMMASKIILANNAMMGKSPAKILEDTNMAICSNNRMEMFVTVWLGILEISTGKLTAANAGHEYPAVRQADGRYELYKDKHGFVIGGMDGLKYKEYELYLKPGSRLFLYTDGVPEATDGDEVMFGTERMLAALNEDPEAEPEQVLEHVRHAVDRFVKNAEQFDDLTMLCMEYFGPNTSEGDEEA